MTSLGKHDVLIDVRREDGRPMVSIKTPFTVYERSDRSVYINVKNTGERGRTTIQRRDDGSFLWVMHVQENL